MAVNGGRLRGLFLVAGDATDGTDAAGGADAAALVALSVARQTSQRQHAHKLASAPRSAFHRVSEPSPAPAVGHSYYGYLVN